MLRVNQVIPSLTSRMDGKETKKPPLHHEGRARTKSEVSRLKAQLGKKSSQPSGIHRIGGIGRFLRRSMAPQVMGLTQLTGIFNGKTCDIPIYGNRKIGGCFCQLVHLQIVKKPKAHEFVI